MKTQKPPYPGTIGGLSGLKEGREQVSDWERGGRQKGLAANPVHGQSWRSLIFPSGWCRQNCFWITAPDFVALFNKASHSFFLLLWQPLKALVSLVQRNRGQRTKEAGRQAWWQVVPWTARCHTWINFFSGRRCLAVDPHRSLCLDETHKILSEVGIY